MPADGDRGRQRHRPPARVVWWRAICLGSARSVREPTAPAPANRPGPDAPRPAMWWDAPFIGL
jgi:hypothetical protein